MQVRIYQLISSAIQSGPNTKNWVLEFISPSQFISSISGHTGSTDCQNYTTIHFPTLNSAVTFAQKHQLNYEVINSPISKLIKKSYSDNFM